MTISRKKYSNIYNFVYLQFVSKVSAFTLTTVEIWEIKSSISPSKEAAMRRTSTSSNNMMSKVDLPVGWHVSLITICIITSKSRPKDRITLLGTVSNKMLITTIFGLYSNAIIFKNGTTKLKSLLFTTTNFDVPSGKEFKSAF